MNYNNFMENLDNIFENPQKITMAQLETILFDTLKFFDSIRDKLTSSDPEVREQALKEATEIQDRLNQVTEKIYAKTGLTKEKASQILSNPSNFKPEDWAMMKNMEKELKYFQKSI